MRPHWTGGVLALLLAVFAHPAHATGWAVGGNGLVIRSQDAGQNWSSSSPTTSTLNAVCFVSETVGWAVGNNGTVLSTVDGGDQWTSSSPGTLNLNDVFFVDALRGWAVGDGGKVLRTTNGGASWTTSAPTTAALHGVFFANQNLGWAVGNAVVLRTSNGGVNWTASAPSSATLHDVYFANNNLGWVVGSGGVVLKTVNGGATWTSSKPTTSGLNSVHFASTTLGWAVGESGSVIKTTNGGTSWSEQRPVINELNSVYFVGNNVGWACGASGVVLKTTNAGADWSESYPGAVALNGIQFASIPAGVNVTVATNPPGRSFVVDGSAYTTTQTFQWTPGSPHTLETVSPQSGGVGTQYVWSNWSNGGAIVQTVAPVQDVTYTATFQAQHTLTMQSGANGTVSPASGWYDAGASVAITATPDAGFGFNGWTGAGTGAYTGWANPGTVTMNGPVTETASFGSDVTVVVQSTPAGASFVVDGTVYTGSQTFTWAPGSSHTLEATTPQSISSDTRYVFTRWSDGGAAAHTVDPVSNTTFTATFKTQYALTMQAGAGGTVTPSSDWKDAGAAVTITATPDSGYSFQAWTGSGSGSYTGSLNPRTIVINGPIIESATFAIGVNPPPPATLTISPNWPNPFAAETEIPFGLPQASNVRIDVFDVSGRRVASDVVGDLPHGWHSYRLDATRAGSQLRSGVYFVRISTSYASQAHRIVVLR